MLFFDIETGPLGRNELEERQPVFEPRKGLKDPVKIAADVESKRTAWYERATLNAFQSKVWAIGYSDGEKTRLEHYEDPSAESESDLIARFYEAIQGVDRLCGYNIFGFDIPYIIRRSYALGISVPAPLRQRKYWADKFIDLMDYWVLGTHRVEQHNRISLGNFAKHLGFEGKNGKGSDYWRLYQTDRPAALDYLRRDVELLTEIWGVVGE